MSSITYVAPEGDSKFRFERDQLIKITSIPKYDDVCKSEVVIDKETFIACYKKWIKAESEEL